MGPIEPVIPSPETIPDTTEDTSAPRDAGEQPPLRAEDVHVRPPDHVTPEAANVELIFERS